MARYNSEQVGEVQVSQAIWKILGKLKPSSARGVIEMSVDERELRMATDYTLNSHSYTDAFVMSLLVKASELLVMLKHLNFLASHVQLEPIVVIPFVKAVKEFYDPLRTKIERYAVEEMGLTTFGEKMAEVERSVRSVVKFFGALFDDPDGSNPIANAVFDSERSQYQLSDAAIENTWTRFFHLYFLYQEEVGQKLPIWHRLNDLLLEVFPAYLDSMTEYHAMSTGKETDELILSKYTESRVLSSTLRVFLRKLWSDKLIALMTRSFVDQQRLASHMDKIKLTKWSQYFAAGLAAKGDSKKLITPNLLTEVMEQSCREYGLQFSQKIFEKLNNNKQLERRLNELQAIFDLRVFTQVYANCYVDDAKSKNKNVRFSELKKALKSPLLPPNMENYWGIVSCAKSTNRFCGFKIVFKQKGTWPVNLILSDDFMDDLSRLMDLWSRLSYHNIMLNIIVTSGSIPSDDGQVLQFERRVQHFVASLRQILYRITMVMQKQINQFVRGFNERILELGNLNDVERYVLDSRQKIHSFFKADSIAYTTLIGLCDLADEFHDALEALIKNPIIDQWTFMLPIRQNFVHLCEQLTDTRKDFADIKSFEAELATVVKRVLPHLFC